MSVDDFSVIARQVTPITEQVHLHVTGEPLLHPEFPKIIRICEELALPVEITTNGTLLGTANAANLLNPIVRQVNISMHALSRSDSSTFKDIFDFTHEAFSKRPNLYINYRLWNLDTTKERLDSAKNEWVRQEIAKVFQITIPAIGHSSGRKSRHILNRLYLHLDTCFAWPEIKDTSPLRTHGRCHALLHQVAILVDGTVVPCCLDKEGIIDLGNCLKESLTSCINGIRAKKVLEGFREGRFVEALCGHCDYSKRFSH